MSGKIYIAEFDANEAPYIRKLKNMQEATDRASMKMQNSYSKLSNAMTGFFSVAALTAAGKYVIDAYKEQELAVKRLEVALGRSAKGLTKYASELQKVTTFGDEAIIDAMALISNYVKEEATIKKLTKATMDLAVAKGMDLSAAAELVAKTVGSSTNALTRYGVEIDKNATGQERINSLLKNMSIFSGQAEGQVDTLSGKFENLTNAIQDNAEVLGEKLLPYVNTFLEKLNKILELVGSDNFDKLLKFMPQAGFAFQPDMITDAEFKKRWNKSIKNNWLNIGGGTPMYLLGEQADQLKNDRAWLDNVLTASTSGKTSILGGTTGGKAKSPQITGGRAGVFGSASARNLFPNGIDLAPRGYDMGIPGMMQVAQPEFDALAKNFDQELTDAMRNASDEFVGKFSEVSNIAHQVQSIFGITADSFAGQLISAADTVASILGIINSISQLAGGGGILPFLGFAKGGSVVNKYGKLSYNSIPAFASGGSYMVPPGYPNDSRLVRVQSGERLDVTPSNQVPMLGKLLTQINNSIKAANVNSMRKGTQPIMVNLSVDGQSLAKNVIKNQNRMTGDGQDFGDYR